ncbi:fatty acid-binding protein, liver-type-like [Sitophilus oryzae]|uniref:Fatty acid-binding protein, liver-type-like n=1 Tax=Sitophilus oryzae TaxID=7048 RepID=A0A6J2YCL3_SITOR|nr:fatty acid-binding protein, liver-type-like [Sitophilus oryzae]
MVQISGSYQAVSNENFLEYIKSFAVADEIAEKIANSKTPVVIEEEGDDKITITYGGQPTTYVYGQAVDVTLPTGSTVKAIATRNGNTITFNSTSIKNADVKETKTFEFSDSGLTSTSVNHKGLKAAVHYKRL